MKPWALLANQPNLEPGQGEILSQKNQDGQLLRNDTKVDSCPPHCTHTYVHTSLYAHMHPYTGTSTHITKLKEAAVALGKCLIMT